MSEFSNKELHQKTYRHWTGNKHQLYRYCYRKEVPLRDGDDALSVNWMEFTIMDTDGTVTKRFSFVTDLTLTNANIVNMIAYGRSRWKIENEHNNTLKTKGYHLEHNFGHGNEHLSNFLITLNLSVFLFHTVAHRFDRRYLLVRKTLGRRTTFFQDVRALTRCFVYDSWSHWLIAMINGLELADPGG